MGPGSSARVKAYSVIGNAGVNGRIRVLSREAPSAVNGSITANPAPDSTMALASE